jgi:hypothetical protein
VDLTEGQLTHNVHSGGGGNGFHGIEQMRKFYPAIDAQLQDLFVRIGFRVIVIVRTTISDFCVIDVSMNNFITYFKYFKSFHWLRAEGEIVIIRHNDVIMSYIENYIRR